MEGIYAKIFYNKEALPQTLSGTKQVISIFDIPFLVALDDCPSGKSHRYGSPYLALTFSGISQATFLEIKLVLSW